MRFHLGRRFSEVRNDTPSYSEGAATRGKYKTEIKKITQLSTGKGILVPANWRIPLCLFLSFKCESTKIRQILGNLRFNIPIIISQMVIPFLLAFHIPSPPLAPSFLTLLFLIRSTGMVEKFPRVKRVVAIFSDNCRTPGIWEHCF